MVDAGTSTSAEVRLGSSSLSPDGRDAAPSSSSPSRRRRRRRRLLAAAGVSLVVAGIVAALVVATRHDGDEGATSVATPGTTEQVQRRDLTQVEQVTGTLDFGESHTLAAGRSGTLTAVADTGTTVRRDGELYSLDRQPTVLLLGEVPMYRDLATGVEDGPDVLQLDENLAELGFDADGALTVDAHFDAATEDAVAAWQEAHGLEATGRVGRGDVAFLSGPVRVADAPADVGSMVQPGSPALTYTSATRVVRVQLEVEQADLAQVDQAVTVTLPDGREIEGQVSEVADAAAAGDTGEVATPTDGSSTSAAGSQTETSTSTTVGVTISLANPDAVEGYATASVDVDLVRSQEQDVLTVPVTALLALLEGGYAVELPAGDGTQLVPVEPGMFADGYVEISGEAIEEGTEVVVPE